MLHRKLVRTDKKLLILQSRFNGRITNKENQTDDGLRCRAKVEVCSLIHLSLTKEGSTVNSSGFSQYYHSSDEQVIYAHLQNYVEIEQPQQLIQRFFTLFIQGGEYPDLAVNLALGRIVDSDLANIEFQYVLNRSCYILINRWRKQPRHQWAIPELIYCFEQTLSGLPSCWTAKRLRSLVKRFIETEQYQALRRLSKVFKEKIEAHQKESKDEGGGGIGRDS